VVVTVAGRDFEIPAMTAADWLTLLMVPNLDPFDVFPGLLDEEGIDTILAGNLSMAEFEEVAVEVIATASARSWWVALRLIDVARDSWDVIGAELGLRGVDATRLSLSSWLDVLLIIVLRNMDPKDVQMFTMRLENPPQGVEEGAEEPTMTAQAFMAMAG
jgi:hypothetical protein